MINESKRAKPDGGKRKSSGVEGPVFTLCAEQDASRDSKDYCFDDKRKRTYTRAEHRGSMDGLEVNGKKIRHFLNENGREKRLLNKRPGTLGVSRKGLLNRKYNPTGGTKDEWQDKAP